SAVQASSILPILNKVGVLLANDTLRGIFGQQGGISIDHCMNEGKILLCNLSKGVIGEDVSIVLGSFITTGIQTAAMRRANTAIEQRRPFHLFLDEAHNYLTVSFASVLAEIRKFRVSLFITHQHMGQLEPGVKSAILGNVGSLICFSLGMEDSKIMEKEFYPAFNYEDFINLPKYHIYIRLLIDGARSKGFSANTPNLQVP
ncbi:MAG: type IV secretory system conjugative DNA transfer family protein, partial [Candidatus Paceibacterota bacterium]